MEVERRRLEREQEALKKEAEKLEADRRKFEEEKRKQVWPGLDFGLGTRVQGQGHGWGEVQSFKVGTIEGPLAMKLKYWSFHTVWCGALGLGYRVWDMGSCIWDLGARVQGQDQGWGVVQSFEKWN